MAGAGRARRSPTPPTEKMPSSVIPPPARTKNQQGRNQIISTQPSRKQSGGRANFRANFHGTPAMLAARRRSTRRSAMETAGTFPKRIPECGNAPGANRNVPKTLPNRPTRRNAMETAGTFPKRIPECGNAPGASRNVPKTVPNRPTRRNVPKRRTQCGTMLGALPKKPQPTPR